MDDDFAVDAHAPYLRWMGHDDANEGTGDGACIEHVWQVRQMMLVPGEGATYEYGCTRCDALLMRPPGQLTP